MGTCHVRLDVDHDEGEMYRMYEDISEEPVKLLTAERIKGWYIHRGCSLIIKKIMCHDFVTVSVMQ